VRQDWRPQDAARWLAEAVETGHPLAPLPPELAPGSVAEGERVALAVLEALGLAACGLRVAPGPDGGGAARPVVGPVIEGRLLPDNAAIALLALRHGAVSAAVVAVLARDLPSGAEDDEPPPFAALHPAIDVAVSRFREPPATPALLAADLGGLGFLVVGRAFASPPVAPLPVTLGPAGERRRRGAGAAPVDLHAALRPAVAAARRLGGLPAGALLVAAGLTAPPLAPRPGLALRAGFGTFGRVQVRFEAGEGASSA
jgi:2-keto-4-pentenoate hydratase